MSILNIFEFLILGREKAWREGVEVKGGRDDGGQREGGMERERDVW
jgi:hypothetical protein